MTVREDEAVAQLLRDVRVPSDGVLFVHSAFRKLGLAGLRVEPFIEALLGGMRNGTLGMPTMTWRNVTPESPTFDELATPSHVGVMPETFRTTYASHRSLHPTHSVAMAGRLAAALTARHHVDDTPVSANSPYGLARAHDAHVLLIGIGLERCTAIHHAEELVAPDVYLKPSSEAELYQCRSRTGIVHPVKLRRHLRLNRDFPQFEPALAAKGKLNRGEIAGVSWIATSQEDLLREVIAALERDPRAIIAPEGAPVIP
ncbi:MAG TPA: AAC(3) family N-acetyltransferase [Alphaproteobacteria bacterium]|jgi:aminoglycoside 3-N-acetyltransferase|nr:AAC(3) family N-acetyltransferase [Alphaproteobacteria bacterium]